jgi:hypothetical protein
VAIEQMDDTLRMRRVARVVSDDADGGSTAMQFLQQSHHDLAVLRIEIACRLVRQEDRRLRGNRACDRDTLLLPTRELRGIVTGRRVMSTRASAPSTDACEVVLGHPVELHVIARVGTVLEKLFCEGGDAGARSACHRAVLEQPDFLVNG